MALKAHDNLFEKEISYQSINLMEQPLSDASNLLDAINSLTSDPMDIPGTWVSRERMRLKKLADIQAIEDVKVAVALRKIENLKEIEARIASLVDLEAAEYLEDAPLRAEARKQFLKLHGLKEPVEEFIFLKAPTTY